MNLESQVSSLELSKKLHELGVKQESIFIWEISDCSVRYHVYGKPDEGNYSAFTASELLELLPIKILENELTIQKRTFGFETFYYGSIVKDYFDDKNLSNSLSKMLIYLIENKLIEV